eukprot:Sro266_g103000.2  (443) ;mRNA; r:3304-4632
MQSEESGGVCICPPGKEPGAEPAPNAEVFVEEFNDRIEEAQEEEGITAEVAVANVIVEVDVQEVVVIDDLQKPSTLGPTTTPPFPLDPNSTTVVPNSTTIVPSTLPPVGPNVTTLDPLIVNGTLERTEPPGAPNRTTNLILTPTPAPAGGSEAPSTTPTSNPTVAPTPEPTPEPSSEPTPNPTSEPTPNPTSEPTPNPTNEPSPRPTPSPSVNPSALPSLNPTRAPTGAPMTGPTGAAQSSLPSTLPSLTPSAHPSSAPSWQPSSTPSSPSPATASPEPPSTIPSVNPTASCSLPYTSASATYTVSFNGNIFAMDEPILLGVFRQAVFNASACAPQLLQVTVRRSIGRRRLQDNTVSSASFDTQFEQADGSTLVGDNQEFMTRLNSDAAMSENGLIATGVQEVVNSAVWCHHFHPSPAARPALVHLWFHQSFPLATRRHIHR